MPLLPLPPPLLLRSDDDDDDDIVPDYMCLTAIYSLYCYVFISIFTCVQILIFTCVQAFMRVRTLRNIKFTYYNILLIMSAEKDSAQPASAISVPPPGVLDTMIRVIMGQTEMTHEEVVSALERTNYDLKRVIREYMTATATASTTATATSAPSSTNQLRFSEIRSFMDKSDLMYYRRKEMDRIYNEVLERKKAEAAATAAATASAASASKL
jgi:hypothetical protein